MSLTEVGEYHWERPTEHDETVSCPIIRCDVNGCGEWFTHYVSQYVPHWREEHGGESS